MSPPSNGCGPRDLPDAPGCREGRTDNISHSQGVRTARGSLRGSETPHPARPISWGARFLACQLCGPLPWPASRAGSLHCPVVSRPRFRQHHSPADKCHHLLGHLAAGRVGSRGGQGPRRRMQGQTDGGLFTRHGGCRDRSDAEKLKHNAWNSTVLTIAANHRECETRVGLWDSLCLGSSLCRFLAHVCMHSFSLSQNK